MPSSKSPRRRSPDTERPGAAEPEAGVEFLTELALDLHWSWNHSADELWGRLDPDLWAATHNPWAVLQGMSQEKLRAFVARPRIRKRLATLRKHRQRHLGTTTWFQEHHPDSPLRLVAYFSMEFALSEALPIYSGGLGNVAGDQLKAACDLGVPVVGIGLLYQQGYFRQVIRNDGSQEALLPYNDPGQLPITPVRDANGDWLRVEVQLPGYPIRLRAWQVRVDRRTLFLLDSNDPSNLPTARTIAGELYGGGAERRLQQELVLGIGGWRLLRALGLDPEVCHLNEGHAALAVLERARSFGEEHGCAFDVALTATRAGNVFTTHTAVPAGFDRFHPLLVERYLGRYAENELGISLGDLLALGRVNPGDAGEEFNMAYLALRGGGAVNGVSRLHGQLSRRLFQPLFPRWPQHEVPIEHVTNGIHVASWASPATAAAWEAACGIERWHGTMEDVATDVRDVRNVSDATLWDLRVTNRKDLVEYVRERMPRELAGAGATPDQVSRARIALDPHALTLGFARRFATYKRPTLLLHDRERLIRLLTDPERPVQLLLAGKAHPNDESGQALIAEWVRFSERPEVEGRILFVPDYDLLLAERFVQGVDLWINTPKRPWEASGTSGMKILVNGGLNVSVLDGWWAEAFRPEVGWAIGDGEEHGDDPAWDAADAEALYRLLEREIVPMFYTRNAQGISTPWVAKMRESMAALTPHFATNRTVREYTQHYYVPAASAFRARAAANQALAEHLVVWQHDHSVHWGEARFGAVRVDTHEGQHHFAVDVQLGGLDPESIRVELFADSAEGGVPVRHVMTRGRTLDQSGSGVEYAASVDASRPAEDYTPRLVPYHPELRTPLEAARILWQR